MFLYNIGVNFPPLLIFLSNNVPLLPHCAVLTSWDEVTVMAQLELGKSIS